MGTPNSKPVGQKSMRSGTCDWHLHWGQSCETETFTSSQYLMSKMIWIAEYPVIVWRIRDSVVGVGKHHIGQYTMLILLNKIPEISYVLPTFSCELCWPQTESPCLVFFLSTLVAYHHFFPFIFKKILIYLTAPGLSCTCGIWFQDQGSNLVPLHWELGVLATGPPGKSLPNTFHSTILFLCGRFPLESSSSLLFNKYMC